MAFEGEDETRIQAIEDALVAANNKISALELVLTRADFNLKALYNQTLLDEE